MKITKRQLKKIIREEKQKLVKEGGQIYEFEGYLTMDERTEYGAAYRRIEEAVEVLKSSRDPEMQELANSLDTALDTIHDVYGQIGIYL